MPKTVPGPEQDPAGWSEPLGSGTRAPSADAIMPATLDSVWQTGLGRAAAGPPAVGEQVIAVLALDRNLTLLDWGTGDRVWRKRLSAPGSGGPLIVGDRVYAATAGRGAQVYAFALRNGKKQWNRHLEQVIGAIAALDGAVVVATERGQVVAFGMADGKTRWTRELPGIVRAGAARVERNVFVATDDSLFLLSGTDGAIRARSAALGRVIAPPAWRGDTIVIASPDGLVAGLARDDLRLLWSVATDDPIFGSPVIARDTVFAVTDGGHLWRVPLADPASSSNSVVGGAVRATPAPVANGVLVGTVSGEIMLATREGVASRMRLAGPIEQPPLIVRGVLLVIDGKGRIEAWR